MNPLLAPIVGPADAPAGDLPPARPGCDCLSFGLAPTSAGAAPARRARVERTDDMLPAVAAAIGAVAVGHVGSARPLLARGHGPAGRGVAGRR